MSKPENPMLAVWRKQAIEDMEAEGFYDTHNADESAIELRQRLEVLSGELRPIIFLDIDGVLNTATHIHEWSITMHPEFVQRIRNVCEEYDADIVVSSAWRIGTEHRKATKFMLMNLGIRFLRIRDRTCSMSGQYVRGDEIKAWLTEHGERPYVIVDDSTDMLDEQKPYFVNTTWEQGFTAAKADEMRAVFDAQGVACKVEMPNLDYFDVYTRNQKED